VKKIKFTTFIISLRRLRFTGLIFCIMILSGIILTVLIPKATQQLSFSESFYQTIIRTQFNADSPLPDKSRILESILGFNPENPIEILSDSQALFSLPAPTPVPSPTAPPATTPNPTVAPEQKPIAEYNIKSSPEIANKTSLPVDVPALLKEPLGFRITADGTVQVLIIHTHTTESYASGEYSFTGDSDRNLDETKNIVTVGAEIAKVLRNHGIGVYHDTTVHDYPSYNGAYNRALATAKSRMAEHPGIRVILDVHRDGITQEDGTKVKVATDINGEKVAQCMFVIGSNALLTHDYWQENLKLACKIQAEASKLYPNLMRPIYLREERFNQQISTGSVILEVGSNGNTLEEAKLGAGYVAQAIANILKK